MSDDTDSFYEAGTASKEEASAWRVTVEELFDTLRSKAASEDEEVFVEKLFDVLLREEDFNLLLRFALKKYKQPMASMVVDNEHFFDVDDVIKGFSSYKDVYKHHHRFLFYLYAQLANLTDISLSGVVGVYSKVIKRLYEDLDVYYDYVLTLKDSQRRITRLLLSKNFRLFRKSLKLPDREDFGILVEQDDETFEANFDLPALIELPFKHLEEFSSVVNQLIRSFRRFLQYSISNDTLLDQDELRLMLERLEQSYELLAKVKRRVLEKLVYLEEYNRQKQLYLELRDEALNPDKFKSRKLMGKYECGVVTKKKNADLEEIWTECEDFVVLLYNDLVVLAKKEVKVAKKLSANTGTKKRRSRRSSLFKRSKHSRRQSKHRSLLAAQLKKKETVRLVGKFKFEVTRVFVKDIKTESEREGYEAHFAVWGKYFEEPVERRGSVFSQGQRMYERTTSVASVESEKLETKQYSMKKLKTQGFEFHFKSLNDCDILHSTLLKLKQIRETQEGKDARSTGIVTNHRRRKRWGKRAKKMSVHSELSVQTRKSRTSRTSRASAECYEDFHPVYIKNV